MFILTKLILPINKRGKLHHLWRSNLILDIKGEKLAEKREFNILVTLIPRYLKPEGPNLKGTSDCVFSLFSRKWSEHKDSFVQARF